MGSCPSKPGDPGYVGPPIETPPPPTPTCKFKVGDRVKRLGNAYGKLGKVTDVIYKDTICSSVTVEYDDGTDETNAPTFFKLLSREKCPFKVGSRVTHKTEFYEGVITEISFLDEFDQEQDNCTTVKVLVDISGETKTAKASDLKINKRKPYNFPPPPGTGPVALPPPPEPLRSFPEPEPLPPPPEPLGPIPEPEPGPSAEEIEGLPEPVAQPEPVPEPSAAEIQGLPEPLPPSQPVQGPVEPVTELPEPPSAEEIERRLRALRGSPPEPVPPPIPGEPVRPLGASPPGGTSIDNVMLVLERFVPVPWDDREKAKDTLQRIIDLLGDNGLISVAEKEGVELLDGTTFVNLEVSSDGKRKWIRKPLPDNIRAAIIQQKGGAVTVYRFMVIRPPVQAGKRVHIRTYRKRKGGKRRKTRRR
jgi:hypothetical protein